MTKLEFISKYESKLRPMMLKMSPEFIVSLYSNQKKKVLKQFSQDYNNFQLKQEDYPITRLWELDFAFPLFNSAGMFKKGESYYTVAKQGAGAYLSGTTTSKKRDGNFKNGVLHPFAPFPKSHSSINWMGLPNEGHSVVAMRLSQLEKMRNCPIGASLSASPEESGKVALDGLKTGMELYEKANVDFIEINESCPNVEEGHSIDNANLDPELIGRLEYISKSYLKHRKRNLPVIVKFSNDTEAQLVPAIIDYLLELGFDGVNFGNTSTKYEQSLELIDEGERKLYEYFTQNFGGGLSGEVVKEASLGLVQTASKYLDSLKSNQSLKSEFHIIGTGGINSPDDLKKSLDAGSSICQWYTGYFSEFSKYGHKIYNEYKKSVF